MQKLILEEQEWYQRMLEEIDSAWITGRGIINITALQKKKLRARADKLFTLAVFKKWGRDCEICGKPATTAHHYVPKSLSQSLRYNIKNGVPICNYCHMSIHTKNDPECIEKIINHRGRNWAEYIKKMRRKEVKTTVKYYEDEIKKLEEKLDLLLKNGEANAESKEENTFSPEDLKEEDIPTVEDEDTL